MSRGGSLVKLVFERSLPCAPERAFPLLTEADRMNLWSTARIESRSPGDGGHPAGVGALRTVTLPRGGRLEEVVLESEPPRRFVYRVLGGAPVRHHEGRIELAPEPGGTRLTWTVDLEFPVRGLARVARRLIAPELERSLDALVQVARRARSCRLPEPGEIDDDGVIDQLYADALAIRARQRRLAERYRVVNDPRYWFTRVYAHVTDRQVAGCRSGRFRHPGWVLRLIPPFHRYYEDALLAEDRGVACETHWAQAFRAARRFRLGQFHRAVEAIRLGMRAHIEDDLPRTLAEVWLTHYRGRCDYVRFRGDYLIMGPIFREAGDRMLREMAPFDRPLRWYLSDGLVPPELRDWWTIRTWYDIPGRRRQAFERGERLIHFVGAHAAPPGVAVSSTRA